MAAIGIHHTATDEAAWDGPANEGRLDSGRDAAYYGRAFAWRDPAGDATTKAAYRFIHHFIAADGTPGSASTRGCSAGIAVLNGGRGGTTIPDTDRQGVYNHLAAHLRDAELEPPELNRGATGEEREEIERRSIPTGELRLNDTAQGPRIVGYAAMFDVLSENLGMFRERIERGAFAQTLTADVRALWQHEPSYVLGRTLSKTLDLAEDERGLKINIAPPDTQWAHDAMTSMKRGDVTQMSFGFNTVADRWATEAGELVRTLVEVRLFDVSPVTFPAYPQTSVAVRSKIAELQQGGGTGVLPSAAALAEARARKKRMLKRLLDAM